MCLSIFLRYPSYVPVSYTHLDVYKRQERRRNKEIHFYVTEEERKLIRRKMIESKTKNMGAYLRKMAIDGYIVNTDTTPLKKQYEEMHKIGVNINQIAKKVNTTGDLYPEEMLSLIHILSRQEL